MLFIGLSIIILSCIPLLLHEQQKAFAVDTNDAGIGYISTSGASAGLSPKYREWNATAGAWSSEVELASTGSSVKFTWLEFSPVSNKRVMIVVASDGQLDSYVCVASCLTAGNWNVTLSIVDLWTANPSGPERPFDLEFEKTSGDLILVYDKESSVSGEELFYRVMTKGTVIFGSETVINTATADTASDIFYAFVRLDSRQTASSDEIAMILQDDTNLDTHVMIWSGSAWGESSTISTTYAASSLRKETIGIAYETNSGDAIAVSGNTTNVLYRSHAAGGAWDGSSTSAGTWAVGTINFIIASSNPLASSNEIFVTGIGDLLDLDSMYWSGSAWTDHTEHDAGIGAFAQRDVDFAWEAGTSSGILIWHTGTVDSLSFKRFNATNSFSAEITFTASTSGGRWIKLATNPTSGDTVAVLGLQVDPSFDISGIKWNGANTNATQTGSDDITLATGASAFQPFSVQFQKSTASEVVTISVAINMLSGNDTPETASVAYTITCTGGGGTHDGNAATQTFLCNPNVTVTVGTPTDTGTSRFRFSDGSTSKTFSSCFAGACSTTTYSSNMRQFLITSLTFKTTGGTTLNTQPSSFTLTDAGSNAFTSISNSWLAQGTSTVTLITWRSLNVTPTANTISITGTGAITLNTNIAENNSPLFQWAIDTGTISGISWDATNRKLTYTGTASGTLDTKLEYPVASFTHAQSILVDGVAHGNSADDTTNGLLTINDISFSAHTVVITFGATSSGGGGGGGGGAGGGGTLPPIIPAIGPFAAAVLVSELHAQPGTTTNHTITIEVTGTQRVTIKEIAFSSHQDWFTVGLALPHTELTHQYPDPKITINVPLRITVPAEPEVAANGILPAAYADEQVLMVLTVSNGIKDITITKPLTIDTDGIPTIPNLPMEYWLVGLGAIAVGTVYAVSRRRKS